MVTMKGMYECVCAYIYIYIYWLEIKLQHFEELYKFWPGYCMHMEFRYCKYTPYFLSCAHIDQCIGSFTVTQFDSQYF